MRAFRYHLSHRLVWVCEIELSQMGKNKGNPDLVFDNVLPGFNIYQVFKLHMYCSLNFEFDVAYILSIMCPKQAEFALPK